MKYRLLEKDSREQLEAAVADLIDYGWRPKGGVAVVQTGSGLRYIQAMVTGD